VNGNSTSTRQKALALNLDATRYGTFAEIDGGQEDRAAKNKQARALEMVPPVVAEIIKAKQLFSNR
jgi:hypothetical protein